MYDRTTVQPYNRTTVQGATFNMRGQLSFMQLKYSTLNFLSVVVHYPDKIITKESKIPFS